jgi:type I restriction-modification system DNA methylase subunit
MGDYEKAISGINELVREFEAREEQLLQPGYNEKHTRTEFVERFFEALGWDVNNRKGKLETYRDVVHEYRLKEGKANGRAGRPDYTFRLEGGKPLFYVEVKKPSVSIKDDPAPAYQVRSYGWSAGVPISIVTNFREFAVYDCRRQPMQNDKPANELRKYFTYRDYNKIIDQLCNVFGRDRLTLGGYDRFVSDKNRKGTIKVDGAFLIMLNKWRKSLASSICRSHPGLDEDTLNFTIQQMINRIIFLRIAEDRDVEQFGRLKQNVLEGNCYQNLLAHFREADAKYNSGLFSCIDDHITPNLDIDNKTIRSIILELYSPCPYAFSLIPADMLGMVYEQFLGNRVRITGTGRARVIEDLKVRKDGGAYFTPHYIVNFVASNTIRKLVKGKTPAEVKKLKIVDPACGSGSFLLGAYQALLDYHKNYYTPQFERLKKIIANNSISLAERKSAMNERKKIPLTDTGELRASLKKEILVNNIYGVDLDRNALQVTRLNLSLKCMEGETSASVQELNFNEPLLPTLDDNIKCGNSLIDNDHPGEYSEEQRKRLKKFEWQKEFPAVWKQGGFDAVIGNPPWVDLKGHPKELLDYYTLHYRSAESRINLYALFIERSAALLNNKGILGFVVPSSLLYQSSYTKLRGLMLSNWNIDTIVRVPDGTFRNVKAETLVIEMGRKPKPTEVLIYDRGTKIDEITAGKCKEYRRIDPKQWKKKNSGYVFDIYNTDGQKVILQKIEKGKKHLEHLCDLTLGITPYDKYKGHSKSQIARRIFHARSKKSESFKPLLEGSDVRPYFVRWNEKEYLHYSDKLGAPREHRFFTGPRILIRQIASGNPPRIYAAYTEEELYNTQSIFNILIKKNAGVDAMYILGLLNSNLMNFYHGHKYLDLSKKLFQKVLIQNCRKLPVKPIDRNKENEMLVHDEIVKNVRELQEYYRNLYSTGVLTNMVHWQDCINKCEKRLNELVYGLYELEKEEIDAIEKALQKKI